MQVRAEQEETKRGSKRLPGVASRQCCRRRRCCYRGGRRGFSFFFFSLICFFLSFSFLFSPFSSLVFSRLSRPSFPFFFFLFSPFSIPFLSFPPSVFIGKTEGGGRPPTTPIQGVHGRGGHCTTAPNRLKGTSPSFFHHVVSKWGGCLDVFLRFRRERERRKAGEEKSSSSLASRVQGKKKTHSVVKTAPFRASLSFFLMNSV